MFFLLCALVIVEELTGADVRSFWFYLVFYFSGFIFLFIVLWRVLSFILNPIKIFDVKEESARISIRNERFLKEFKRLNIDMIEIQ